MISATTSVGLAAEPFAEASFIDAGDNGLVSSVAAKGSVTEIAWTKQVASDGVIQVDAIVFTVGNEDTVTAHTFVVCAVIEGPAGTYSPATGSAPECLTTASIAADAKLTSQTIDFSTAVDVNDLVDISISIEEVS